MRLPFFNIIQTITGKTTSPTVKLVRLWGCAIAMGIALEVIPFLFIIPQFNLDTSNYTLKVGVVNEVKFSYHSSGKGMNRYHHYAFTLKGDSTRYEQEWRFGENIFKQWFYNQVFTKTPFTAAMHENDTVQFYIPLHHSNRAYGLTVNGEEILPARNQKLVSTYTLCFVSIMQWIAILLSPIYFILLLMTLTHIYNSLKPKQHK